MQLKTVCKSNDRALANAYRSFLLSDSSDSISRRNRLVRNLSDLMIIDESEESYIRDSVPEVSTSPQRRKSIRFNEEVERIETL